MHSWADQIVSLADDIQVDYLRDSKGEPVMDANGQPIKVTESVSRTRLRIETRKWLMAKILPAVFGDKLSVDAHHTHKAADDAELLHQLREAASAAGVPADALIALITGQEAHTLQ